MSFTRKVIDGARSGLNSLMNKIAADDTPLSHVDEGALQQELEARMTARKGARPPGDNPLAKLAGASAQASEQRKKMAERRAAKVASEKSKRAHAESAAREAAFRDAQQRAQQQQQRSTRERVRDKARSVFSGTDPKIVEAYKTMQLEPGTGFIEVKRSYRKLMRKYHPDLHNGNPKKQKAATELSVRVTQAYNLLEKHLNK